MKGDSNTSGGAGLCLAPALHARTARELLGDRPLPALLRVRPVVFVLGPAESGKSSVAARLFSAPDPRRCDAECLRLALNRAARNRKWCAENLEAPGLWLDAVDCLHGRYGAIELLGRLLSERARAGRRTVLCQGPADASLSLLYGKVAPEVGASVLLRFPVGRGRKRFVADRCRARGIDPARAAGATSLEPWSYAAVERFLDRLAPPA